MNVYTSTYRYTGADRLDVTAQGQDPVGKIFAPDWRLVNDYREGHISFLQYRDRYYQLMRNSYRQHRQVWNDVLARNRVTLVCFCNPGESCHRLFLANIFVKLGAIYEGEI